MKIKKNNKKKKAIFAVNHFIQSSIHYPVTTVLFNICRIIVPIRLLKMELVISVPSSNGKIGFINLLELKITD